MVAAGAATASACTPAQRTALADADTRLAALEARGASGTADARGLVTRAARRCESAPAVRAIVRATAAHGQAHVGVHYDVGSIALVGVATPGGGAYRLDWYRMYTRAVKHPGTRASRSALARLRTLAFQKGGMWLSPDPTARSLDPVVQSHAAALLARADRVDALALVAVYAHPSVRTQLAQGLVDPNLVSAILLQQAAARLADRHATSAATRIATAARARLRAAAGSTWSVTDGHWSSLAEHRRLLARGIRLVGATPSDLATAAAVQRLRVALTARPVTRFLQLPAAAFYPWPADGAWDSTFVLVALDKPATISMRVYDPATRALVVVRQVDGLPGGTTLTWDGTDASGHVRPAGAYPYTLVVTDLPGNRAVVPGLDAFTIARDTTPPVVRTTLVRHVRSEGRWRTVKTRWVVDEPLSPVLDVRLVLTGPGGTRQWHYTQTRTAATVKLRLHLRAGRWKTRYIITDGSGNRVAVASNVLNLS